MSERTFDASIADQSQQMAGCIRQRTSKAIRPR